MKQNAYSDRVFARNGREVGYTTGGERQCPLEGCRGERIGVRWKDGSLTWPCTAGMKVRKDKHLQII